MKYQHIATEMLSSKRLIALEDGTILRRSKFGYKVKKLSITNGYYRFNCSYKNKKYNFLAHQIIWLQFNPNQNMDKMHINHKDNNRLNNKIENLELVTAKENVNHAINIGAKKDIYCRSGDKSNFAKIKWEDALFIKANRHIYGNIYFMEKYKISQQQARAIALDKSWKIKACPEEFKKNELYGKAIQGLALPKKQDHRWERRAK